jgi:hypothetical protein
MNNAPMPDWIKLMFDALHGKIPKDFVGQVEVNVFKGGITNVNIKQSYKQEG